MYRAGLLDYTKMYIKVIKFETAYARQDFTQSAMNVVESAMVEGECS